MKRAKLKLSRDTLRVLASRELKQAAAGMDGTGRDPSCDICEYTMPHGGCL